MEEVLDFAQEDLEEDDVMILDAWKELFVWVGESARKEEKQEAIKTALVMLLLILKELPGSWLGMSKKFSLHFSSSSFVIRVNPLHPQPSLFLYGLLLYL